MKCTRGRYEEKEDDGVMLTVGMKIFLFFIFLSVCLNTTGVLASERYAQIAAEDTMVYADGGGNMISDQGYFDVEVRSEDQTMLSSIRIFLTALPNENDSANKNAPYPNSSHQMQQKITWTTKNLSDGNPYALSVKQDPYVRKGKNTTYTLHGSIASADKAYDPAINDGKNPPHYMEAAYTVFIMHFSYMKTAFTYPENSAEGKDRNVRFSDKEYILAKKKNPSEKDAYIGLADSNRSTGWMGSGTSTLKKGIYHQDQQEEFALQINLAQTGLYLYSGQTGVCHAKYVITLKRPRLVVSYRKNGATEGKVTQSKEISYNDSDQLHSFSSFGLKRYGYQKKNGEEWNTAADGSGTAFDQNRDYSAVQYLDFTDGEVFSEKKQTVYAQWRKACNVFLDPNGGTVTTDRFITSFGSSDYAVLSQDKIPVNGNRKFLGWFTEPDYNCGRLIYQADGDNVNDGVYWSNQLWQKEEDVTLYAHWSGYRVTLQAGEGILNTSGGGVYQPGETVAVSAQAHKWYDFEYWAGTLASADNPYIFSMPAYDVALTATATNGKYKIAFHSNGGEGFIDPIYPALIGKEVTLPDVLETQAFTHRNEYGESLFLGWNPDGTASAPLYGGGETVPALSEEHEGTITLYAIWDTCPGILAKDRYYTLKQAKEGMITQQELLSHAKAFDREDGEICAGTDFEKNTCFEIADYSPEEFTCFTQTGSVEKIYRVIDSSGNFFLMPVTIYIVDTAPTQLTKRELYGTTRFLSEKYFGQDAKNGGLDNNSVWRRDPEYKSALERGLKNLGERKSEAVYYFSYHEVQRMKAYLQSVGAENTGSPAWLTAFYHKFLRNTEVK